MGIYGRVVDVAHDIHGVGWSVVADVDGASPLEPG